MTEPFKDRAADMGLDISRADKGLYFYSDIYSEVVYRQFYTGVSISDPDIHETDHLEIPYLGVFIKPTDAVGFNYCGFISQYYRFIGNDMLNEMIRNGIRSVGQPLLSEEAQFSSKHERMRNEIVIQSPVSAPQVGDVYPMITTHNGYNGTRAASLSFGFSTTGAGSFHFNFRLGELRMVHIATMTTNMSVPINDYLGSFGETILETIQRSFSTQLVEQDFINTLDMIEEIAGKRRKNTILNNMRSDGVAEGSMPTAWQMFVALARYTTLEPNLNTKKLLENMAERVLVIPTRMQEVLTTLSIETDT